MGPVFPIKATAVGIKIYVEETPTRTFCAEILSQIKAEGGNLPLTCVCGYFLGSSASGLRHPGPSYIQSWKPFLLGLEGLKGPRCGE